MTDFEFYVLQDVADFFDIKDVSDVTDFDIKLYWDIVLADLPPKPAFYMPF